MLPPYSAKPLQLLSELAELTGQNWQARFERFVEQTGLPWQEASAEAFVVHLHAEADVDTETLLKVCQRAPIEVSMASLTGSEAYEPLGRVGVGAMGEVFLVRDKALQRRVALKRLLPEAARQAKIAGRFVNEARLTAGLNHPNIVPIYSLEQTEEGAVYTMKLVQGRTLKQILAAMGNGSEAYDRQGLLEIFLSVCEAMDYAHQQGVLHRDLKPANLMIGPYREVYVMDWGIARRIGGSEEQAGDQTALEGLALDLTQAGEIPGTPRYMSPEQIRTPHSALDGRSDLFALGTILYELLTLQQAFQGRSVTAVLKQILTGQFTPWQSAKTGPVPVELRAICAKALAVRREARYASVAELAADLRSYARGEAILARPDTFGIRLLRQVRRHQQLLLATVLGLLLLSAAVLVVNLYQAQRSQQAAHLRENRINGLLSLVASQSQQIDSQFLDVELSLQEFTAVVAAYLTRFPESKLPYYFHGRFQPADLKFSPYYANALSTEWPIAVPTYTVKEQDVRRRLHQLSPLRDYFKRLFVRNAKVPHPLTDPQQRWQEIAVKGQNIGYMTTTLAEGFAYWYPGLDIDSRIHDYDPKKRDYYNTIGKYGFQWGTPQVESSTLKLVIPVATAVYDPQQAFIASTVFAMSVDEIVRLYLDKSAEPAIKTTYLLDAKGNVLVSSEKTGQHFSSRKFLTTVETTPFPQPEVVAKVKKGQTGYSIYQDASGKTVVTVFYRLRTIDWFFAVTADLEALLE